MSQPRTWTVGEVVTAALLNAEMRDRFKGVDITTGSISSSVTETVIGTFTSAIPSGDAFVGRGYEIHAAGTTDHTSTPTLTFRVRLNSATGSGFSFTTVTGDSATVTGRQWAIESRFWITATGGSGTYLAEGILQDTHSGTGASSSFQGGRGSSSQVIDTTVTNSIVITAQWGTSSASNIARTLAGTVRAA